MKILNTWVKILLAITILLIAIWVIACVSQTVIVGEDIESTKRSIVIDVKKDSLKGKK